LVAGRIGRDQHAAEDLAADRAGRQRRGVEAYGPHPFTAPGAAIDDARLLDIVGLTKVAALEHAARGIRVNAVAPGPTLNEQLERAGEAARRGAAMAMPMRRVGRPEEVAETIAWLCSDAASFITGATVPINGGKLAGMAPFVRHDLA
jgi:hypothetical protein